MMVLSTLEDEAVQLADGCSIMKMAWNMPLVKLYTVAVSDLLQD